MPSCLKLQLPARQVPPNATTLLVSLSAALVTFATETPARADETYICPDGRMVTVRFGEFEKLARTDQCLAAYKSRRSSTSGASPQLPASTDANAASPPVEAAATPATEPPLPVRKPATKAAAPAQHAPTEIIVHYEQPPVAVIDNGLRPRVEHVVFRHAQHRYYNSEPLPDGPPNFRNVPIINAGPGEPSTYRHAR